MSETYKKADAERISRNAFWEAKDALGISSYKPEFKGGWVWGLPKDTDEPT